MAVGRGSPADSSMAGQYTAWNRSTPLPARWIRWPGPAHQRRNARASGPAGRPGRAEVLKPAADEREHLAAAGGGLDPQPPRSDFLRQLAGVAGQAEEPVLLG